MSTLYIPSTDASTAPSGFSVALLVFNAAVLQKRAATVFALAVDGIDEVMGANQLGLAGGDLRPAMARLATAEPTSQAELAAACSAVSAYFGDAMLFDQEADELWDEEITLLRSLGQNAAAFRTLA